jgi:hypothetical protein
MILDNIRCELSLVEGVSHMGELIIHQLMEMTKSK